MSEKTAKVAAVLNEYSIAVNIGSDHGVRSGDRVTLWTVIDVVDPDSKEPLGTVRLPKLDLNVEDVQDRLCVARVRGSVNVGQVVFRTHRSKISTRDASDSVVVSVGEEATVYLTEEESSTGTTPSS